MTGIGAVRDFDSEYKEIYAINLQKDRKAALLVNGLALLIAAAMIVLMNLFVPLATLWRENNSLIKCLVFLVSLVAYTFLHELVHGIAMKAFGTKKVKFGFTGMYAFACSDDYYNKKSYIVIALAPVVVFLFILGLINAFVPTSWFWVVYFLQVYNISGAAGDLFVTVKFAKMPEDILVKDSGVGMVVYSRK